MNFPWFRLYTEFASDPKVQILAFEDQRHYVMLLCLKGNGTLDTDTPNKSYRERLIAKALGLDPVTAAEAKRRMVEGGLIGQDWQPLRWAERQPKSDHDAAERKRDYRARIRAAGRVSAQCPNDVPGQSQDSPVLEESRLEQTRLEDSDRRTECAETDQVLQIGLVQSLYPKRAGGQRWGDAEKAINARLREGHTADQILDGVTRYAAFIRASGKERTEYVMQAATFFGTNRQFLEDWTPPPTKADVRLGTNLSSAAEFMRRTEQTDAAL